MQLRLPWILSLVLNAALAVAVVGTWRVVNRSVSLWPGTSWTDDGAPGRDPALRSGSSSAGASPQHKWPAANPAIPTPFHWSQIESDDYRQYIANLRAVGCPERLIRDLVVADLDQLYARRGASVRAPPVAPWTGGDTRAAVQAELNARTEAIKEEHRAVLRELLGFAWQREASELWNNEAVAWMLLGFLGDDQAVQVAGLVEPLQDAARRLKERVDGILLAEDRAALEQLRTRFRAELAGLLTPQQTEEFDLRIQALGLALSGKDLHFESSGLAAHEAREIVRLSLARSDFVREELLDLKTPEEDQAARRLAFEAGVERLLGPQRYPAFARAQDERFREAYDFSRERQLPEDVAVRVWEIRQVAEAEAEALHVAGADGADPSAAQQQLRALQESAALSLTALLGTEHMSQYLDQHGGWLTELDPAPAAGTSGEDE